MPDKAKMNALENVLISRAKQSNCQSYVEFLAHQALIQSYLAKGFNVTTIWKALSEEGLITFKYSTFSKYLRQAKPDSKKSESSSLAKEDTENLRPIETTNSMESSNQESQHETATKLSLPDGMSHNPMINPKDLI